MRNVDDVTIALLLDTGSQTSQTNDCKTHCFANAFLFFMFSDCKDTLFYY